MVRPLLYTSGFLANEGGNSNWNPEIIGRKTANAWEAKFDGSNFTGTFSAIETLTCPNISLSRTYSALFFRTNSYDFVIHGIIPGSNATNRYLRYLHFRKNGNLGSGAMSLVTSVDDNTHSSALHLDRNKANYYGKSGNDWYYVLLVGSKAFQYSVNSSGIEKIHVSTLANSQQQFGTFANLANFYTIRPYRGAIDRFSGNPMTVTNTSPGGNWVQNVFNQFHRYENSAFPSTYAGVYPGPETPSSPLPYGYAASYGLSDGPRVGLIRYTGTTSVVLNNNISAASYSDNAFEVNGMILHTNMNDANLYVLYPFARKNADYFELNFVLYKLQIATGNITLESSSQKTTLNSSAPAFTGAGAFSYAYYLGKSDTNREYVLTVTVASTGASSVPTLLSLSLVRIDRNTNPVSMSSVILKQLSITSSSSYANDAERGKFWVIPYYDDISDPVYNRVLVVWTSTDDTIFGTNLYNFQEIRV